MIIHNVIQGSDDWHKIRSTKFTASNFYKLFAKPETKTYQNFINEVVFARLTGELEEGYTNSYMQRGIEMESEAIMNYEFETFNKVHRCGFIEHSEWIGCSPDGLIGEDGMIQVKCPKATTLMDYYGSQIPKNYMYQIQGELFVSGRKWSDFYVYHPKLKPQVIRVVRDEQMITDIICLTDLAVEEAKKRIKQFKKYIKEN